MLKPWSESPGKLGLVVCWGFDVVLDLGGAF